MDPIRVREDDDSSFEFRREVASLTWKIFQDKFTHTPLLDLPSMASKINTSLDNLKHHTVDVLVPKMKFMEVLEMIHKLNSETNKLEELEEQLERCLRHAKKMDRFLATLKDDLKEVDDQHRVLICNKDKLEAFLVRLEEDIQKSNEQHSEIRQLKKMDRFLATLKDELKEVEDRHKVLVCKKDKLESSLVRLEEDIQKNNDKISEIRQNLNVSSVYDQQQQLEEKFEDLKTFTWSS